MEFLFDLDVICCRGSFDSSRMRVFIDISIANDMKALLQDRVLVLCGVGSWQHDVIALLVVLDTGRYRMVGILEDSLDDVDALFVQKIIQPLGLDVVHMQSSLWICR